MRRPSTPPGSLRRLALARAKNTARSEARRRTRESLRAEQVEMTDEELEPDAAPEPTPRPRLFKMPNVRADLRALPSIFLGRRLLWVPLLLLGVGFVATLLLPGLAPQAASIVDLYVQFFFAPPALFTFFIAGFVAPRASYLFGLLYGLIAGGMWSTILLTTTSALGTTGAAIDPATVIMQMVAIGALYGTLAAAFAAWYRDFLRGMQERGKARRAEAEAKERGKRRDERQESRRAAKQRPSP